MNLDELTKKLKGFDCEALRGKPVVHRFVSSGTYSYIEEVEDVFFDAVRGEIVLTCKDPQKALWDNKAIVSFNPEPKKSKQ